MSRAERKLQGKPVQHHSPFHRRPGARGPVSRHEFLWQSGGGLGGIALASLLGGHGLLGGAGTAATPGPRHPALCYPPRAKRVIQLFIAGAASHIDLFDFKPDLVKYDGKPSDFGEHVEAFQDGLGPWKKEVSKPIRVAYFAAPVALRSLPC